MRNLIPYSIRCSNRYLVRYPMRWMAGFVLGLGYCFLAVTAATAQGAPVVELGADYNYVRANAPPDGCGCFSMHGANGWFAYNVTHSFAVVAEVSSQRRVRHQRLGRRPDPHLLLVRATLQLARSGHFAPFGQVLLGGAHASGSFASNSSGFAGSSNAFALIAGGGLDIGMSRHFAIRALEADYHRTQFEQRPE